MEQQASQGAPAVAPKPTAKPVPKWQRWATIAAGILVGAAGLLRFGAGLYEAHTLPACDSQRAKDTLSDIFKEQKLSPTSYSEIKTISQTSDLVDCEAICHALCKAGST